MKEEEFLAWFQKMASDLGPTGPSLAELIGESYAKKLASMTAAEADQHLRSLDGDDFFFAYLFFSSRPAYVLKGTHPFLAEACLKLMASPKSSYRGLGAGDIRVWLEGTRDKRASQALATMVRDANEENTIKAEAYRSLQIINKKSTFEKQLREEMNVEVSPDRLLQQVDWDFVDSFLR